jgi:hypothetical protein
MNMYQGLSDSAVCSSSTISSMRRWIRIMYSMFASSWRRIFSSRDMLARWSIWSAVSGGSVSAFARRLACQPGFSVAAHSGSVSQSSRTSIDDGVRWKTYSSLAAAPRWGMACTAVAPVPMIPTTLSARFSRSGPV